jgi:putative colanic acid biosynthesis acetyltransferase WcaF
LQGKVGPPSPITIGDRVWIAAEAFVSPGVAIADGAVLGARGCTFTKLEAWTIYRGNPAVPIGSRTLRAT